MIKKLKILLTASICLLLSQLAFAQTNPLPMLQSASNSMLAGLEKNQGHLTTSYIFGLVNRVLVPIIDVNRMAGAVLGRKYWFSATPAQRNEFIRQFKSLVISTYASALKSYNDDQIKFYPLRGGYNRRVVTVNSVIIRRNGQRIPVSYNLVWGSHGWRIYDFSIENVSMVQSYRSQFAPILSQSGVAGLIAKLKSRR